MLRSTEYSGWISKWSIFLSLRWKHKENLTGSSLWEPSRTAGGKTLRSVRDPLRSGPLEFLMLKLATKTKPSTICQLQCKLSYAATCSHRGRMLPGFCSGKLWFSVFTCYFSLGDSGLPCDVNFLMDLKRVVFSLFSFLPVVRMGAVVSKLLTCWTRNWKSNLWYIKLQIHACYSWLIVCSWDNSEPLFIHLCPDDIISERWKNNISVLSVISS